tara:strand:- start:603 stop:995 length:393 start_codon:yes stop_codon:yes gene_type:complete
MKYHPDYPIKLKPAKKYTQEDIDKLKKQETEAAAQAYKVSRRLGKRDKNHAEAYGNYLNHKANLSELRRYERTGEWTNNMVPGTNQEIYYRVVAEAYDDNGKLKSAPEGSIVDGQGRIINDGDVSNGNRK